MLYIFSMKLTMVYIRPQRQPKSPEKNERRTKSRRGQTPQKVEERSKAPQMPLPLPPIHAPAISGK